MNVVFEVLPQPTHQEPRVRAVVNGMTVVWKHTNGWRCRCGKSHGAVHCRHVRAVQRALPEPCRDALRQRAEHLGWAL